MVYEVDPESYPRFCKKMGWSDPPEFGSCRATLGGSSQAPPPVPGDAREAIKRKQEERSIPDKKRKVEEPEPLRINVLQLTAPKRAEGSRVGKSQKYTQII